MEFAALRSRRRLSGHTLVTRHFKSLAEYSEATGQDQHSVLVDYDMFVNVDRCRTNPIRSASTIPRISISVCKPGSAAVDAGVVLPTINDDFTGRAPDLGAYELDRPLPHYGPRTEPLGQPPASAPRSLTGPR